MDVGRERRVPRRAEPRELSGPVKPADYWRSIAPVKTGAYRRSIHVERRGKRGYRVVADDYKAAFLEYGTVDTPEFAPAAKTVKHYGGTMDHHRGAI